MVLKGLMLWNETCLFSYQLNLLIFSSLMICCYRKPLLNLSNMMLHGSLRYMVLGSPSHRLWLDDNFWRPSISLLLSGTYRKLGYCHCVTKTHCLLDLVLLPLVCQSYIDEERVLNLCNGMQFTSAPGSTLTSAIIVPALSRMLIAISVMISDLLSGSVSVYSLQAYSHHWCFEPIYY